MTTKYLRRPIARRQFLTLALLGGLVSGGFASVVRSEPGAAMPDTGAQIHSVGRLQVPAVTLLLATDRAISKTRDPVTFVLALDNASDRDVVLTFSSSQVYDILVTSGDVAQWSWAADRGFGQVITERTYPPGVTLLGRETWSWHDLTGKPVPPGLYRALPSLLTIPPQTGNTIELTLDVP